VTDPRGIITTNAFDAARRLISSTAPNGLTTTNTYDPDGHVIRTQQSANGVVLRGTGATYTPTGKPATATDANGNTTSFSYDLLDRVSSVKDAMSRVTSYGYDALGRQISVANPAIQSSPLLQKAYTLDGLVASLTDANSHTTNFAYDGFDRLATSTYPLGSTEAFTYDDDDNVLTRKTRAGQTISFAYDTLNRLKTKNPAVAGAGGELCLRPRRTPDFRQRHKCCDHGRGAADLAVGAIRDHRRLRRPQPADRHRLEPRSDRSRTGRCQRQLRPQLQQGEPAHRANRQHQAPAPDVE